LLALPLGHPLLQFALLPHAIVQQYFSPPRGLPGGHETANRDSKDSSH
jgi:hypothetical protein